ncbi:MAG: hypothetical protein KBC02_01480 [Candidatus Pacebacteria bacterium]|nr:hypothetical protein [Candidatus Paceibacterota bacterium]
MSIVNYFASFVLMFSFHLYTGFALTSKEQVAVVLAAWVVLTLGDIADEIKSGVKRLPSEQSKS